MEFWLRSIVLLANNRPCHFHCGTGYLSSLKLQGETMRLLLALIAFVAFIALSATVVKNDPADAKADKNALTVFFSADKFDAEGYVTRMWDSRILPSMRERAVDLRTLMEAVRSNEKTAGEKYGYRAVAEQNPYNFSVTGRVKILSANVKSRNGRAEADVEPFDGQPDITLQLGPIYKGTALRDCLDFVSFDDFKNQVEFAKLATQLSVYGGEQSVVPLELRKDGGVGRVFELLGATTQNGANTHFSVVPVLLTPVEE